MDQQRRERVVVGVDGSEGARAALAQAWLTAARRGAELEVVGVYATSPFWQDLDVYDPSVTSTLRARTEEFLAQVVAEARGDAQLSSAGHVDVRTAASSGSAARVLLERARDADVLVVGSRGRGGVRSALLGSVALHCATHAACPVVVVHRGTPQQGDGRVVVGLDGSSRSRAAIAAALREARDRGAEVEAVVAYQLPEFRTGLSEEVQQSLRDALTDVERRTVALVDEVRGEVSGPGTAEGPPVHVRVVEGPAREVLVDRARGAELLVVGSTGHGELRGLALGSVALHCAMHAPAPVMVVRPQESDAASRRGRREAARAG